MTTAYPGALDSWANPSATTNEDEVGFFHDELHANKHDAIEAIEAKLGIDGSAVATTIDYLVQHGVHPKDVAFTNDISPAQLTANTDNWNPTGLADASVIRASTDASRDLTGIAGGADGRWLILANVGSNVLVLKHDVTSTAANRFLLPGSIDFQLGANTCVALIYDSTSSRWRLIGGGAGHKILSTTHTDVFATDTPTDGQVLTWVNSLSRWEAQDPAGGVGGASTQVWLADNPPASPHANDDEFDDATLDTGVWTEWDPGSFVTVTEDDYGLKLRHTGASGVGLAGIRRAVPSGDWAIVTKVSAGLSGDTASAQSAGLFIAEDLAANPSTADVHTWEVVQNSNGVAIRRITWSAYNAFSSQQTNLTDAVHGTTVYLRIRRISGNYSFDFSTDGLTWMNVDDGIAAPFTVAHVGLFVNVESAIDATARFRFWRQSTDTADDAVLQGAPGIAAPPPPTPGRARKAATNFLCLPGVAPAINPDATDYFVVRVGVTNFLFYSPIYLTHAMTFDAQQTQVTTAVASSNIRIGLYEADPDWQPTDLLEDSGNISSATTGTKTFTYASPRTLSAGRYLLAIAFSDGTVQTRTMAGTVPGAMAIDIATGFFSRSWRVSHTFGALPNPGTDWDTHSDDDIPNVYYTFLRCTEPNA